MASISASIELYDRMSAPLNSIMVAMNQTIGSLRDMQSAMNSGLDTSSLDAAQNAINEAASQMERLSQEAEQAGNNIDRNSGSQNQFNHEVNSGVDGMNKLESAVKGVVTAIGGMFAIQKVVGFINDCTDAAATQRAAETQLATTLVNMGGTAEDYDALVKKAQEIQKAGMYGDEALIGAAAEFSTYMTDETAIEMMMDALTDYAAGMSGGGAIDYDAMVNYATNLGKITTGAYDAMTKKGFEFTDAQKAVIDGTATEAQYLEALGEGWQDMSQDMASATIISEIIGESWEGMYDSLSNTPEAQLISLKNTLGDLQEQAGNRLNASLGTLWSTISSNMPMIEGFMMSAADGLGNIIEILANIIEHVSMVATFVSDNWSIIAPIVTGIAVALGIYNAALIVNNVLSAISAAKAAIHAAGLAMEAGATFTATAAQYGFNAALLACPITWIIIAIIAVIALIFAICSAIAKMTGVANSGFGVITGGINVAIQFFKNLGLTVANIALGIGNALGAVASNMMTAFHNAICSVQAWFYNLLSTALTVVEGICAALNKLPFVEFDYSGITSKAQEYADKAAEAEGSKGEYQNIGDAFNEGMSTFDTFQDGWASDAFKSGAAWGDGVADKVSNMFSGGMEDLDLTGGVDMSMFDNSDFANQTSNSLGDIANNTGKSADAVDISNENLKYLRDIAETEAINKFTTAEISVNMTNNNNVSGDMDIDGMVDHLSAGVLEAMEQAAEGVH